MLARSAASADSASRISTSARSESCPASLTSRRAASRLRGSRPNVLRHEHTLEKMRAKVGRQIGVALRAQMVAVPEQIGRQLVLTEPHMAGAAFGHGVLPAELIEENSLFVVQLAGPVAVEMKNAVAVERDGVIDG